MATPCNCDTFTSTVTISNTAAPQLVVLGGGTASARLFPQGGGTIASVEVFSTDDPTVASYSRLRLTVDGATAWLIADAGGSATAMPLALQVGGAERLRVTTAGLVGIGTSSPQQALDVNGTVRMTGALLGGNMLLSGAITDSTGQYTRVDYQGCYYS